MPPTTENDSWRDPPKRHSANSRIAVSRVLALVASAGERARGMVLARFRAAGGDLDRWSRHDETTMAEAITRTEDEIELGPPSPRALANLRAVRRMLEGE